MQSQQGPPAESLADAARKARAQKTKTTGTNVYTEDKLSGLSGHGVSVVGAANQEGPDPSGPENSNGEGSTTKTANTTSAAGKFDERYWRDKAGKIHDQMAQIDEQISKIRDEIQKYGAVSFDPSTGLRQNVIYVEDRNAQVKQLEGQKDRLQSQLDSLEEEGRKAGADSGWFR